MHTLIPVNDLPTLPAPQLELRRGVLLDDPPEDERELHRERMRAAVPHLGTTSWFTRHSAAVLHGLPLFHADLEKVHLLYSGGGSGQIRRLAHVYKTPKVPPHTTVLDGLPVTTLARTAADLMRRTYFGPALALADAALRLGASRAELLREVKGGRGCRHSSEAVRRADARSESPYESQVRAIILQQGVPLPELQVNLFDADGFAGRSDFLWRQWGVVGEFDGAWKYSTLLAPGETVEQVLARQQDRQGRFEAMGLRVVRWGSEDVHTPGAVAASIRALIGDVVVDHRMCPEAHDYRKPRHRR